jgi:hypothetical protein
VLQKLILIFVVVLFSAGCRQNASPAPVTFTEVSQPTNASAENGNIVQAFKQRKSNVEVEGKGEVVKILSDDNNGLKHQKFLVKISPEQTLLFAYNLDLAPRIEPLAVGDMLEFKGEYVYNPKGGIVHWTHKDPQGQHEAGWIKHNGQTYQ